MMQFRKKSIKFLALLLTLTIILPIATQAFAWRCGPRHYHCCPPPRHYYHRSCYGGPAVWGFAGFTTGVVVGSVITSNQNRAAQQTTPTVTRTETLHLIFHKF